MPRSIGDTVPEETRAAWLRVEGGMMPTSRIDLMNAFTSIANALDTPVLKLRGGFIGGTNVALPIWERLGRLIYENRAVIDSFGQFALPPFTMDTTLPAVATRAIYEEVMNAADFSRQNSAFTLYCWAVLNSLQNSGGGPCLDAYPYARRTLELSEDIIGQQGCWDDASVSALFRAMGSQLSRGHRWQDLLGATRETVRWLIARIESQPELCAPTVKEGVVALHDASIGANESVEHVSRQGFTGDHVEPSRGRVRAGGRPPLSESEVRKRRDLVEQWHRAKAAGIRQDDFCEDQKVTPKHLNTCVNWLTKRRKRGASI